MVLIYCLGVQTQSKELPPFFIPDTTAIDPSISLGNRVSFINGNPGALKAFGWKSVSGRSDTGSPLFTSDFRLRKVLAYSIPNLQYLNQLNAFYYSLSYRHILVDKYRYGIGITFTVGLGATYDDKIPYLENLNTF